MVNLKEISTNELKVNLENLTTEERKQLTSLLKKSQTPKKSGTWFPEMDEMYWIITHRGIATFCFTNHCFDKAHFKYQDLCTSDTEARQKLDQQAALVQVNRQVRDIIAKEHPDWQCDWGNGSQCKFYPWFDHESRSVVIAACRVHHRQFLFEHTPAVVWERIDEDLIIKAMGV